MVVAYGKWCLPLQGHRQAWKFIQVNHKKSSSFLLRGIIDRLWHVNSISSGNQTDDFAVHYPVLLSEVLHYFSACRIRTFVDGTVGAGGHSEAILKSHNELELYFGLDVDPVAHTIAKPRIAAAMKDCAGSSMNFIMCNFGAMSKKLTEHGVKPRTVDGILLDIGVSSMQIDEAERGFSFLRQGPLDMRMNPDGELSALDIVNNFSEAQIGTIIREYGEDRRWRQLARKIVDARLVSPIKTTTELASILGGFPSFKSNSGIKIHPATRTFQALRIAVNNELDVLESVLPQAVDLLAPGGRLAVISFHSLEDRIVKRAFLAAAGKLPSEQEENFIPLLLQNAQEGRKEWKKRKDEVPPGAVVRILTKRPITAGEDELRENSRSRSAKLRVVEKL